MQTPDLSIATVALSTQSVTLLFVALLLSSLLVKLGLTSRQIRHVMQHRHQVPSAFAEVVTPQNHQRAADYTVAQLRFGMVSMAISSAVLIGWTLLGGLQALNQGLLNTLLPWGGAMAYQLGLLFAFSLIGNLIEWPLALWHTFRLEQVHGFNRTTLTLWLSDQAKSLLVGLLIGGPMAALVLWLMGAAGTYWWLWAWLAWSAFTLLMMVAYPTLIAPLFNKFEPLSDPTIQSRVEQLMSRCGFKSKGLFVMDGSKRSAHGNAYFTGLGSAKRVVFFDTLLKRLNPSEVEAVLAHELGHFKHKHVAKRMALMFVVSLGALWLLGWLSRQPTFYLGLGVTPSLGAPNHAVALLLLGMTAPLAMFFTAPVMAYFSRKDEFQADAYACQNASGPDLSKALVKLYEDNAATLTPDPLYVRFYYSHPPASERLARLNSLATA
jgi:STE24 endopeptidase